MAQVDNDNCAQALEILLEAGQQTCTNGSNDGAVAEVPYISQVDCAGGVDMPASAADVWYQFIAVGNRLDVQFQSGLRNSGSCFV